jgi:hypothetical protein
VRVRRRREATPSTTLPTTREVARFTGGNVDASRAHTRRTRRYDSPYQYRMPGLGNPSRSGHPPERRKNLSRAERLIAVGAIGVASALIPATAASAGQSWVVVPETTPCGASNAPFWCGVVVPRHHHFWEIGVCLFGCGESALIGRTPIAGYHTGPPAPSTFVGVSEGLAGPTPPWLIPVKINYWRWCPYGPLGDVC